MLAQFFPPVKFTRYVFTSAMMLWAAPAAGAEAGEGHWSGQVSQDWYNIKGRYDVAYIRTWRF